MKLEVKPLNRLWNVSACSFTSIPARIRKRVAIQPGMKNNKNNKFTSVKRRDKKRVLTNHRLATKKSMLKRIKICGPRWNPTFKFKSTAKLHLNRNRSSNNLRRKKKDKYISKADYKRVMRMIPYAKFKKFKDRH